MKLAPLWIGSALVLTAAGCAAPQMDATKLVEKEHGRTLAPTPPADRLEYLRRAHVFAPVATGELDLLAGPQGPHAQPFEAQVTCTFYDAARHHDGASSHGRTKKFYCTLADGQKVKVKYGRDNREIYGSVMATRLFWALGVATDIDYPVRVHCLDCPADPWEVTKHAPHPDHSPRAARDFDDAIIQQLYAGVPIEACDRVEQGRCTRSHLDEGWHFSELARVDATVGGAGRAEIDAFRLLTALVAHGDNKHDNQRLVCPIDAVGEDGRCTAPRLMIGDLGATFGRGASRVLALIDDSSKISLEHWAALPVWKSPERCQAYGSVRDGHSHPIIGEAGRALLAEKLAALSDAQLSDLFTASRVERLDETFKPDHGGERKATVADWVATFKAKRAQISERRCPQ